MLGRLTFPLALLLLALVAGGYGAAWSPWLAAFEDLRLHLGVVAGGLFLLTSILKLPRSAIVSLAAAGLAAWGLGPILSGPQLAHAQPGGRSFTLLYGNLWDDNPDPLRLRAALVAADADILVTSETMRSVTDGAGGVRAHYPYRLVSLSRGTVLRTAIWSKFPLRDGKLYLNNTVAPTGAAATVELGGGQRLRLIGGHFSRALERLQKAQTDGLRTMAAPLPRPLVVVGDFNASPWSWVVQRAERVTGTRLLGGHRITWKGRYPTPFGPVPAPWGQQIDQLLVSPGVRVEDITTVELPGSDHRGLLVRLSLAAG